MLGASVSGVVEDSSGAGLAGSTIPVGDYQITASKQGFTSQVKTGISLVVGQHSTIDLELQVGELKQVVTIEENSSPVSMSTQETAGLVSERQVKDLPLNGRSFDLLMTLNPAVVN